MANEQKLIFLDIDGCICTASTNYLHFDLDTVKRLNKLIAITDADIVVSSSWRSNVTGLEKLKDIFRINGAIYGTNPFSVDAITVPIDKIIGMTPCGVRIKGTNRISYDRSDEIKSWLRSNKYKGKYIILDDEDHDLGDLEDHLVLTDSLLGLSDLDVDKALQILGY